MSNPNIFGYSMYTHYNTYSNVLKKTHSQIFQGSHRVYILAIHTIPYNNNTFNNTCLNTDTIYWQWTLSSLNGIAIRLLFKHIWYNFSCRHIDREASIPKRGKVNKQLPKETKEVLAEIFTLYFSKGLCCRAPIYKQFFSISEWWELVNRNEGIINT